MELAKAYDPSTVETRRYEAWRQAGVFDALPGAGTPYCITIPPPNVTGSLHIGHALNNSIIDCLIRWRRMMGDNVLCLPGTDHAGIATQAVVEREIAKEGLTRHDLGRDRFVERCWEWRREYGDRIYTQFQRLGCSYDWSRTRFTLDRSYVDSVYEEFLRWWDRGLIYRGIRVVNWCPRCSSAISDIEVNTEERQGTLFHIRYPLEDGSGWVTIATTRPETMLGDTAVVVHPDDGRYSGLHGRLVSLPLTDRTIPIIPDSHARMDFGTGAVKVTPAHDLDDFEIGIRHQLPQLKVIGDDARMTEEAGDRYAGLDRYDCRSRVLEDLQHLGLLERDEPYVVKTPLCDRCRTVLEPLLSEQWFARQEELAQIAIRVVEEGRIRIHPERYTRVYLDWMTNIRDWCISRQLWWGHRIPIWWAEDGRYSAGRSVEDAASRLGVTADSLRQDEDVLDTWFSSALWPHATLGWPKTTDDLAFWYPTNVLSTAQEILYLWVARMIMTGMDFMGDVPFRDVYIHATVLDARGERMSKSKGNGVDPLEMIDKYGADALRLSLLQHAGKNQDIRFSEERVKLAGAFANKLWNVGRFVLAQRSQTDIMTECEDAATLSALPDRWIVSRLHRTIRAVEEGFRSFDLDDAVRALHGFVWDDFCDWYVEAAKGRMRQPGPDQDAAVRTLVYVMDQVLRLLHPIVPHVTEELWQALHHSEARVSGSPFLAQADFPRADVRRFDDAAETDMDLLIEVVRAIRNTRSELKIPPAARSDVWLVPAADRSRALIAENQDTVRLLGRVGELTVHVMPPNETRLWAGQLADTVEVFVRVDTGLDLNDERRRLDKEIAEARSDVDRCRGRLDNEAFVSRAPSAVVDKERARLQEHEERLARLLARLAALPPDGPS